MRSRPSSASSRGSTTTSPTRSVYTLDGRRVAVTDTPGRGDGAHLFLSHATGFCGDIWIPFAEAVTPMVSGITRWDYRGHGRSSSGSIPLSWWETARDAAAVRDSTPVESAVAVGHSMGGAAAVMAQLARPDRFAAMVLIEPIIVPPPFRRADHPFAKLARKRRRAFASREEAFDNFAGKPPFAHWHPDALAGYLASGFRETADGVELACAPEFEAEVYVAAGAHGLLQRLHEVEVPTLLLVGSAADTYPLEWAAALADRLPKGRLEVVEGGDHFLPMAMPERVAETVSSML